MAALLCFKAQSVCCNVIWLKGKLLIPDGFLAEMCLPMLFGLNSVVVLEHWYRNLGKSAKSKIQDTKSKMAPVVATRKQSLIKADNIARAPTYVFP